jgi:adenylate cyclase
MSRSEEQGDEAERIAAVLRELDVPADLIARAVERHDPEGAVLEATLLPARGERTVSAADVEEQGGLEAAQVVEIVQAMGFPPPAPDEPWLTPEEAAVFVELGALSDVWSQDLTKQSARLYGRLLARIARTGVQLFRLYAEPRLHDGSETDADRLLALRTAFERLASLPPPLLVGIHRRWMEYELAQTARTADTSGQETPGAIEVTLLFCDLKDFTAYANSAGDAAAVETIDAFANTVERQRGEEGHLIKALGDGHMLAYPEPVAAVAAGARVIAAMRARGGLGVHASVHRGIAISRDGDYFGEVVNLAARLLAAADRHELVATGAVVEAARPTFEWESIGSHEIRGVDEPVEVFRLIAG